MAKASQTIPEQIFVALDGRTQRWLSVKTLIPEVDLSRRLKGKVEFTDEELSKIEEVLSFKIKRTKIA